MGALTQPNQWETMGLECDKMSEQAVTFHLQHVIGELKKHLGPLVGTGLQHILLDSYEAGKPSWTPLMPQEFAQRRGYDLKAFLPTFAKRVVGSDSETKKFRSDFDRTIADLYRDKLFATMSRMLAEANLRFVCEPYGGPFNTGEVTPYVHRVMTEFWSGDKFSGGVSDGLFNAGAGKRHNILEAEAFTGGPGSQPVDGDSGVAQAGRRRRVLRGHQPPGAAHLSAATVGRGHPARHDDGPVGNAFRPDADVVGPGQRVAGLSGPLPGPAAMGSARAGRILRRRVWR